MTALTTITQERIQNQIYTIRGKQVMIDRELAILFGVDTKRLNEQVKRNSERFPEHYCFRLTIVEKDELVANCDQFKSLKHSSSLPYAFLESGVAMSTEVYHIGASLKDLGKKWFAFSRMDIAALDLLNKLN